jgi:hypothetical protein
LATALGRVLEPEGALEDGLLQDVAQGRPQVVVDEGQRRPEEPAQLALEPLDRRQALGGALVHQLRGLLDRVAVGLLALRLRHQILLLQFAAAAELMTSATNLRHVGVGDSTHFQRR